MNYQIRYTKVESSPPLVEYIETKLVHALKRFAGSVEPHDPWQFTIEVGRETTHHRKGEIWFAEVTGATSYGAVRVRSEGSDIREAIDITEEDLKATLSKSKGKLFSRGLRAARRMKRIMRLSHLARFLRRGRIRDEGV